MPQFSFALPIYLNVNSFVVSSVLFNVTMIKEKTVLEKVVGNCFKAVQTTTTKSVYLPRALVQ